MSAFQYSLNSSTIKTTPILQKIQVAAKAGYAGIELWHDDMDAHLQQGGTLQEIRKCLDDCGLAVPTTIHMKDWFQPAGDIHTQALEEAKRKFEQAAAVGAPHTVAGPPHGAADRELGKRHYRELLELGATFGVLPAFEYLGFVQDIKTVADGIDIITGCGHPAATLVLDPFHCYVGGGGLEAIGQLTASQIAVSHFNDAPAAPAPATQRDPDRVMPGDGAIDLKRYCQLLKKTGFTGFLSLELFRPDLWEKNPLDVAIEGLKKTQAVADAA
ncbi:MAG: sugar phosphate isomerase/epimerase [Planctomycetaceae bacterium]